MNTLLSALPALRPVPVPAFAAANRRTHRERHFGVGYGASSGYAGGRRYAARDCGQPRFRFA